MGRGAEGVHDRDGSVTISSECCRPSPFPRLRRVGQCQSSFKSRVRVTGYVNTPNSCRTRPLQSPHHAASFRATAETARSAPKNPPRPLICASITGEFIFDTSGEDSRGINIQGGEGNLAARRVARSFAPNTTLSSCGSMQIGPSACTRAAFRKRARCQVSTDPHVRRSYLGQR